MFWENKLALLMNWTKFIFLIVKRNVFYKSKALKELWDKSKFNHTNQSKQHSTNWRDTERSCKVEVNCEKAEAAKFWNALQEMFKFSTTFITPAGFIEHHWVVEERKVPNAVNLDWFWTIVIGNRHMSALAVPNRELLVKFYLLNLQ